jgi:PAS domain S-box-containing protein
MLTTTPTPSGDTSRLPEEEELRRQLARLEELSRALGETPAARVLGDAARRVEALVESLAERWRLEEVRSRAAQQRYRRLFESSIIGLAVVDTAGLVRDANDACLRMVGYPREDIALCRLNWNEVTAPEFRARGLQAQAEVLARGYCTPFQTEYIRRDGRRIAALVGAALLDETPPQTAIGFILDLTERKRAEDALRFLSEAGMVLSSSLDYHATLARLAELAVSHLADWCFVDVITEDGATQSVATAHVEPAKVEMVQKLAARYSFRDVTRQRVLRTGRPETGEVTDELLAAAIDNQEDLERVRRLGFRFYLVVPLQARERTLGVLTLASTDPSRSFGPTDLALAEETARRAGMAIDNARLYQQAQRAIRARDDLLAIVSHDLRNPLSLTLMNADLLAESLPPDETGRRARDRAHQIRRSATRMSRLIGDLLDAAAIETGSLPISRTRQDVAPLVEEALEMMRPMAHGRTLALERVLVGDVPAVDCDRERILQVFSNLIGNAIKFTPQGGAITVSVERVVDEVRFAVTDTGPGIIAEDLPHVFDRYWRAKRTERGSVGLGLYIVKGIVEAHGGRIWVESRVGIGSTFYFTLPATV